MKIKAFGLFLFCVAFVLPAAAAESDLQRLMAQQSWTLECIQRGCIMQKTKISQRYGDEFAVYLTGTFERSTQKTAYYSINLPPGANPAFGVVLIFADRVGTGADAHTVGGDVVQVPFMKCDAESCVARIMEGMARNTEGKDIDLIAEFLKHEFVAYQFMVGDEKRDVLDSLYPFHDDYQKMLAELKKPQ